MELDQQFEKAQNDLNNLTERPSNEEFLELYALFKQATVGNNTQSKPSRFNLKKHYKWKSWMGKKGLAIHEAQQQYVELVGQLLAKYHHD